MRFTRKSYERAVGATSAEPWSGACHIRRFVVCFGGAADPGDQCAVMRPAMNRPAADLVFGEIAVALFAALTVLIQTVERR